MWNSENDELREFHYYNDEGVFIGKSEGIIPQQDLFDQAHYVFDNDSDIIKNLDLLAIANRKLRNLRHQLLGITMKEITRIMELNDEILELEKNIEVMEKHPLAQGGFQHAS
jgi:hypothetical protein